MFDPASVSECESECSDRDAVTSHPLDSTLDFSQVALTIVNASPLVLNKCLAALSVCELPGEMHAVEIFIMSWEQFLGSCSGQPHGLVMLHFDGEHDPADGRLLELRLRQFHDKPNTNCIPVVSRGSKACKLPREVLKHTSVLLEASAEIAIYENVVGAYLNPVTPLVAQAA